MTTRNCAIWRSGCAICASWRSAARRSSNSVKAQDKLTPQLEAEILGAESKARLEDIYLPYKPKRRTKATIAREAGLAPLAADLLADPTRDPRAEAARYVDEAKGVKTPEEALEGARAILVEQFSEKAELIGTLRENFWARGRVVSKLRDGKAQEGAKYADYFDFFEPLPKLPSHRILALFRAEKEEILDLALEPESATDAAASHEKTGEKAYELAVAASAGIADRGRPADKWLMDCARWAWRTRIKISLAVDLRARLWRNAEDQAVKVFAGNLRDLLLAAPAGPRPTMGLDPGFRTGVKVAVVDATGKVVDTGVIYPHEPQRRWDEALLALARLCRLHKVELIAIGNGTASRETDRLAGELVAKLPEQKMTKIVVSEAGASVYSASAFAAGELPDLDVTLRGAVSIARRLQDPLAELVKIDPKSIGVGQYQHDLAESNLSRALDAVVEDCVNAVGVDLNTASAPLLARVSGLGANLAANVVAHRDANGPFRSRDALKKVPRLGAKAFEQCAGFLRIRGGDDPLDASGVHPEAYPLVRKILAATRSDIHVLIGSSKILRGLNAEELRRCDVRGADGDRRVARTGKTRPRPAAGIQDGEFPGGRRKAFGPQARHGAGRRGDQCRGLRGLCRHRGASGRAGPYFGHVEKFRQGPARGRQAGRRGQGQGCGGRCPAQAHRPHHATRRRGRAAPVPSGWTWTADRKAAAGGQGAGAARREVRPRRRQRFRRGFRPRRRRARPGQGAVKPLHPYGHTFSILRVGAAARADRTAKCV